MVLQFIPDEKRYLKTIFYGIDGTGKSTGAKIYCESRGLKPVVIDFDYTNHTGLPRLRCDWNTDKEVIDGVISIIRDVEKDPVFDTLIIDGVGTFNNLLLPNKAKESQRTYLLRTQNFKKIWKVLLHANIHVIFIGQKDMIVTEENESSKFAEMINNMVDYKFHCTKTGKGFTGKDFTYVCTKSRNGQEQLIGKPLQEDKTNIPASEPEVVTPERSTMQREPTPVRNEARQEDVFMTAAEVGEPKVEDDPVRNSCMEIKRMLEREGKLVTKQTMKAKVIRLIQDELLPPENRPVLMEYIQLHCPEELE